MGLCEELLPGLLLVLLDSSRSLLPLLLLVLLLLAVDSWRRPLVVARLLGACWAEVFLGAPSVVVTGAADAAECLVMRLRELPLRP
jgi:hypothetical protein